MKLIPVVATRIPDEIQQQIGTGRGELARVLAVAACVDERVLPRLGERRELDERVLRVRRGDDSGRDLLACGVDDHWWDQPSDGQP